MEVNEDRDAFAPSVVLGIFAILSSVLVELHYRQGVAACESEGNTCRLWHVVRVLSSWLNFDQIQQVLATIKPKYANRQLALCVV